jgi:hypothetical protein
MDKWTELITQLSSKQGVEVTTDPSRWNLDNPEYLKIYNQWVSADFNMSAIKWINYYPGQHFEQNIATDLADSLGISVHRAWISKINPGYFAPWHWDVDDNEEQYLAKGEIKRFSIFLSKPHPGHFFTTDDETFSNTQQGMIYQWKNYRSWHAGANAGLTPKYMFHLVGFNRAK